MKPIKWALLLFSCLGCVSGFSQSPTVVNSGEKISLDRGIDYLIDSTRQYTIEDVLQKPFQQVQTETINFGTVPANIWLRFSVRSKTEKDLYLDIMAPLLDTLEVVEVRNESPSILFAGGITKPFWSRPIESENWLFNLDLHDGGTHTYYLKVHSSFPLQMPITLFSKNRYAEYDQSYHLFWGLYIGVILFAFVYNFFIYLSVREKRYLYYILYLLFSFLFYMGLQGYAFQFLWSNYPHVNDFLPIAICLGNILVILFMTDFLTIGRHQKFDFYFGVVLIVIFCLIAIVNLTGNVFMAVNLAQLLSLVACTYYIIAGVRGYRRRVPGARYFLVAWTVFLVFVITYLLSLSNLVPANFLTSHGIFIGHMTEAGLLSFALASRINWLKSENEKKQKEIIRQLKLNEEIQLEANRVLEQKVIERTAELKASQALLIQREKLASLGELTAGIAHEIQNPLNFVTNFSQVSEELVHEIDVEISKGHTDEVQAIAGDLRSNIERISFHGHRASNIVKGMLEHSRANTGEVRPTNLNALADEFLRIAYQGQRAKDKDFDVVLKTDFDAQLPLLNVVPQEIGRVLLNLYNNAFYAVWQRSKSGKSGKTYEPTVWVSTQAHPSQVLFQVRDNGSGIDDGVKAKIFQPFFTTKPTGEGTGLGLSLSYDIITKGYGGELSAENCQDGGVEFTVTLPIHLSK